MFYAISALCIFALLQPNYNQTTEKLNAGVAQLVAQLIRNQ